MSRIAGTGHDTCVDVSRQRCNCPSSRRLTCRRSNRPKDQLWSQGDQRHKVRFVGSQQIPAVHRVFLTTTSINSCCCSAQLVAEHKSHEYDASGASHDGVCGLGLTGLEKQGPGKTEGAGHINSRVRACKGRQAGEDRGKARA